MTPTARSLAYARRCGWAAGVVEHWNSYTRTRHDLFGWCDLIVLAGPVLIGVQACAGASHSVRAAKVRAAPTLPAWLATGARAEVWSWSKRGERGKRKLWTLRRERIEPSQLQRQQLGLGAVS